MDPLTFDMALTVAFFSLASGGLLLPIWVIAKLVLW